MQISNIDKLIYPVVEGNTTIRYYVTKKEIFDILNEAHIDTGHGGQNKMYKEVQKNIRILHKNTYLCIWASVLPTWKNRVFQRIGCKANGVQRYEL